MVNFIKMKKNYKVSYRTGWLIAGNTYPVQKIEGTQETAKKLIKSGWAVEADGKKVVAIVPPILSRDAEITERENAVKKQELEAKNAQVANQIKQSVSRGRKKRAVNAFGVPITEG